MPNAKGTVMVGLVKRLRRERERARELLAPELAHYLEERINLGAWYPLEDFLALLRLTGKFAPVGTREDLREPGPRGCARAHGRDLQGVSARPRSGARPSAC